MTITQLTEQVSTLQMAHNKINSKLNRLTEMIMANVAQQKIPSPLKHKAGGLQGDSSQTIMRPKCSRQWRRFPSNWCSTTTTREPSMHEPLQHLDKWGHNPRFNHYTWGHHFGVKNNKTIWVMLQNISGIPQDPDGDIKLDSLRLFMRDNQADIAALTELNTAWDLLHYNLQLPTCTHGWWELAHWSVTHNKCNPHQEIYQLGGMAVLVTNSATHRATQAEDNGLGLGCLIGKHDTRICIVSLYRPCPSRGHLSTNQQQICWSVSQGQNCLPHNQILINICEQIQDWQVQGRPGDHSGQLE